MRTMTVDTGENLRGYVETLVASGDYKTNSEVVRDGLRLLREKQATSKLAVLRRLIDEGDNSPELAEWSAGEFMTRMHKKHAKK